MSGVNRYKVLILEDDPRFAEPLVAQIEEDEKFEVLGVTASSEEAYKLLKAGAPDVVIVDLQLTEGDGYELLARIRDPNENLSIQPYVFVSTWFASDMTMSALSDGLADYVYKKQNESYSPEKILNHLHIVSRQFRNNRNLEVQRIDSAIEAEKRIRARITRELDQYYMNQGSGGKEYLIEIIYRTIQLSRYDELQIGQMYIEVGKLFRKEPTAIDASVRRLIDSAFLRTDPKDLQRLYPPYLDIGRGAPRNKEFVAYVADKIKKEKIR